MNTLEQICESIVDCEHKTAPRDQAGEHFAVGTPAMRGNVINLEEARRISSDTFEMWTKRLRPRNGDLLLAREAPVGPVVRIPREENIAPGQRTVLLRPNPARVSSEYLFYALTAPSTQQRLQIKASGSTVHHLNVADIRSFALPLPPLREQQATAEVLGALDDKIAANAKLAASIDDTLAAAFERDFGDASDAPLSGIADVNAVKRRPENGGELRYLDISSVGVGRVDQLWPMPWTEAPGRARRGVRAGDTVWSTVRPNRRSHALILDVSGPLVASTGLAVLTPTQAGPAFLYEATRRPKFTAYLENVAEGSAYPAVRADRFAAAPIPKVERTARDAFEDYAMPLRERQHAGEMESVALAALRDALLPELMSGRLRVKDAERSVEEVL